MTPLSILFACHPVEDVAFLEGFGYRWEGFNHRLSHVEAAVHTDTVEVAIVGGTSTTAVYPDLPAGCERDTCDEFPVRDESAVWVEHAVLSSRRLRFGRVTERFDVGSDGFSTELSVPVSRPIDDGAIAVIEALRIDSDVALSGSPCYLPQNGWLPRDVRVALGEPVPGGDQVRVPLEALFTAGLTFEDERACLDEVADEARVALEVTVLVVATGGESARAEVASHAVWELGSTTEPIEQVPPGLEGIELGLDAPVGGWSALSWRFHRAPDDGRGAYLRELGFRWDAEASTAGGWATNQSRGTQLSGFDYDFEGTMSAVESRGDVVRTSVEAIVPADVDDSGAVVHTLEVP